MKIGPTHTHKPATDLLTIPAFQVIGHNKQFLGLNQFHLPPQPPTTYKAPARSCLHKLQAIQLSSDYSPPLQKSYMILLVKHFILVHIQVTCTTCACSTSRDLLYQVKPPLNKILADHQNPSSDPD
jgi:hypothetical protein